MAMVILSRDGVLFLMSWEVMALSAFFLVETEEKRLEAREAAWIYLVATHTGAMCLLGFFALLRHVTGSFDLWPTSIPGLSPGLCAGLFIAGTIGFGLKAGIMPLHFWLPGAHANAPSHVSAIMSGVFLKMGVYGMVRIGLLIDHPPIWWGASLLAAGAFSGIFGIALAAGQQDFKRLLAYSSIENIGIICMGLGLALLGRSLDKPDWIILGLGGALLHVLNHSLFKPLLFMGAGGILHATRTRDTDRLGGLSRTMSKTFALFVVGVIAICGLPPLNGFVSEWLIYLGLFRVVGSTEPGIAWASLAAPALASVGALAVLTFIKLVGTAFAGTARTPAAAHAHDPGSTMLAPMALLAACCVVIGIVPALFIGIINRAVAGWLETPANLGDYVPFAWITAMGLILIALIAAGVFGLVKLIRRQPPRAAVTWDCGYAKPSSRIQYTSSSFSQMLMDLVAWALRPRQWRPKLDALFPGPTRYASAVPDLVLDGGLLPAFSATGRFLGAARIIQRGSIQLYLVYVLGIVLLLLTLS
jgi:hydrogenase-4 component B